MSDVDHDTVVAEGVFSRFRDVLGPYLDAVGISPDVLNEPSRILTTAQFVEVLEVAAVGNKDDCLGLRMGITVHPKDVGVLGYTLISADSLKEFFHIYELYFDVFALGVETSLSIDGNYATWTYHLSDPGIVARRQDAEFAMASFQSFIQQCLVGDWRLKKVSFEHSKPEDISEHSKIFNAPIYFGCSVNSFVFNKSLLDYKLKDSDKRLFHALKTHLDTMLRERIEQYDLVAQVTNYIASTLCDKVPTLAEVAEFMGMPHWTLQRRLREKNRVYNQLLADTRQRLAKSYLGRVDLPLTEVAFLLGYSEVSTFSRAFKQWTGSTPLEYRKSALLVSKSAD